MRRKRDRILMAAGGLMVAAAVCLSCYNNWDMRRAEKAACLAVVAYESACEAAEEEAEDAAAFPIDKISGMQYVTAGDYRYIGEVLVPALELTLPVVNTWSYPALKDAPCRYEGNSADNSLIIAAHNYERHFGNIGLLAPGEAVIFTDVDGTEHWYEVTAVEKLGPYDTEEMRSGDWDLTLFTCTYGGRSRITVRCKAVAA